MARPKSDTVDYFSHDTHASDNKTLTILEGEFGLTGYAFWFKLLEWLGHTEGFAYDAREDEDLEFLAREFKVDVETATGILDKCAKLKAIDRELWGQRIIWSDNFVNRLSEVYRKRGRPLPSKPSFCGGNPSSRQVSATEMPQSKVKDSKVKDTIIIKSLSSLIKIYQQEIGKPTPLIEKEIETALKEFGADKVQEAIKISSRAGDNKKNMNYIAGILANWKSRRGKNAPDPNKYIKGKYGHIVQR